MHLYQPVGIMADMIREGSRNGAKSKLLDAAVALVREKGYAGTSVEDLCVSAGVSKGAFFYHFKTKEDLAVAAAAHFSAIADEIFAGAPYRKLADPLDRLLGYVDFRTQMLMGRIPEFTCLLGTMVQEAYETHPEIRVACEMHFANHICELKSDISEAVRLHPIKDVEATNNLAVFMQAAIQGAFVLAKASGDTSVAVACLRQLYRHIQLLFNVPAGTLDPLVETT